MVRTSYGNFYEDQKYKEYIKGLEEINVPYGFYHFSYATDVNEAKKEAEGFLNIIKNYKPLYPVVLDVESTSRTEEVRGETLIDIADTFCKIIEDAGYYAMIYANLNYFNNKLNSEKLDKYDKWLAQWSDKPTYNKSFGIWQYTSEGKISGIKGNVDLNIAYKDYPAIIKNKKLNNYSGEEITAPDSSINYVVKKGDNLSGIAKKYNTTYKVLADYNNISNPNKIYVNQIIKIPTNVLNSTIYVVKKGDTLSSIAKRYNTTWKKLYEKNKVILGANPNKIKPGQVLKI